MTPNSIDFSEVNISCEDGKKTGKSFIEELLQSVIEVI